LPKLVGIAIREVTLPSIGKVLPKSAVASITLLFELEAEGVIAVTEVLLVCVELIGTVAMMTAWSPMLSVASRLFAWGPAVTVKLAVVFGATTFPAGPIGPPAWSALTLTTVG
jgi:hypothetical protein